MKVVAKKILVLCTGNSCRSQMAHGYLQNIGGDKVTVYGAGIETHGVNPIVIGVMAEDGVDISKYTSNHIDDYMDIKFDLILTVCDSAKETCPYFPSSAKMVHHSFEDPAGVSGTANEVIASFRRIRDEIKAYSHEFLVANL